MPLYETIFIARQDLSTAQVDGLTDQFSTILADGGGNVAKKEYWGLRNLSFRIKKNRKGHYVLLNVDALPAAVNEMERNMRINEDILRFQTVRVETHEEGPSAILRNREREGREGREGGRDGRERRGGRFDRGDRDRGDYGDRHSRDMDITAEGSDE